MKLSVLNIEGKETGREIELSDLVFSIEPNNHSIYLDVKQHLAHQRQGTHKAKERSEVKGSTRKIKKQKGTGGARAGSIRNPLFTGGGRVFGPKPHKYEQKLNKNLKRLARRSALSLKASGSSIKVIEDFSFEKPKTKSFTAILKALGLDNKKSVFVLADKNNSVYLASRNLSNSGTLIASELNTYEIINAENLVFFESSIKPLEAILG